jgi:hypothetical protein
MKGEIKERYMHTDIRIGTLVKGSEPDVAGTIKQILPHGFLMSLNS